MSGVGSWLRVVTVGVVSVVLLAGCGPVGGVEVDVGVGESLRGGDEGGQWARAGELAGEAAGVVELESVSAQDVRGFYERFGSLFDSAVFARAFAERVGPGVLADFAVKVGEYRGSFETADGRDVADEVVGGLGAVELLSTGGVIVGRDQGPVAKDSEDEVRERVGQWRALGGSRGFDGVEQMFSAAGQRYPMLVAGPEFVVGVVPAVLEWDVERVKVAREPGWVSARRVGDVVGAVLSVMDEPGPVVDEAGWARVDAVQEVLSAQTSFDVDLNEELKWVPRLSFYKEGKAPVRSMPVAQYLVGHRFVDGFKVGADGGETLGRVLAQAASVGRVPQGLSEGDAGFDAWREREKRSTTIAGSALMGFQEGLEIEAPRVKGQNAFSAANAGLRSWMGEILAPHAVKIAQALVSVSAGELAFVHLPSESAIVIGRSIYERWLSPQGIFVDLRFDQPEVNDGGTPEDSSDDVYPRGRIPASERLLLASLEGYHEQLIKDVIPPHELSQEAVMVGWVQMFDALLVNEDPSFMDAVDVTAALNEHVARLRAGHVVNAPLTAGAQRHKLDQIQASPWTHEAVPTLQAIFPQEEDIADAAEVTGRENRIDLLGKGFFIALAEDPQLLQKYPKVHASMSADILGDNLMEDEEDASKPKVVLPIWLHDTSNPMPKLQDMTDREKRAFMSSITEDSALSHYLGLTTKKSLRWRL